ncbi:MAG: choice-of-anchor I family protein [Rhodobacterales bacterium]|nr:choice-of-anchor I family protein [Rhodobacterales bacterium]
MSLFKNALLASAVAGVLLPGAAGAALLTNEVVWTVDHTTANSAATTSEIVSFDSDGKRIYVAGGDGVDVIDSDTGVIVGTIAIDTSLYDGVTSVAYKNGMIAIAAPAKVKQDPGTVFIYDVTDLTTPVHAATVGANPDMVTFTADGGRVLVANEGEPNDAYTVDPVGSISIVQTATGTVQTAGFDAYNASQAALTASGVRIFGPGATVAQDLEPEYIAISPDGTQAFVTLQENNAIAVVDLGATPSVTEIIPLGYKDHSLPGNGLDASDKDGGVNITTHDNLYGMYQPDGIASVEIAGTTYYVTANEGDARDYDGFSEEKRVKSLDLDPAIFPAGTGDDDQLGRLNVTNTLGNTDADSDFEELYVYGGRSFSILDEDGNQVFDSGDMIEQILAASFPDLLDDGRSDNKGPEPENVTIGELDGYIFAFIGLERSNAVMAFDITDPTDALFAALISLDTDVSPEGLAFANTTDGAFLVVANEVSGTTTLYRVGIPAPAGLPLLGLGLVAVGALRRRKRG